MCSILEVYKNIVFTAGLRNPYEIQYSKVFSSNIPVEWNDSLLIDTTPRGGPITVLKGMDDRLIIFKESSIYFIAGGQNNFTSYLKTRGGLNTSIELALISGDIGCVSKNSCVLTPLGIMFKSNKGVYLLERSLNLSYVGDPIRDYNHLDILDSQLVADSGEVRFLTDTEIALIYNYERNMWYTYSQHGGSSNTVINGIYYYTNANDVLVKETKKFSDLGSSIPLKIETGWLSFAEVQGFQRVYRLLLLGTYKSSHSLRIRVAYNYDDTWVDEKEIILYENYKTTPDATGFFSEPFAASKYGSPPEWDVPAETSEEILRPIPSGTLSTTTTAAPYGGAEVTQYQFRVNFKKQKCEAIKILVEDIQDPSIDGVGEGLTMSNLSFLVGIKGGDYKIKQSRVKGTT